MKEVVIALFALLTAWGLMAESRRRATQADGRTWITWGAGPKIVAVLGAVVLVKIVADGLGHQHSAPAVVAAALYGMLVVPLFVHAFFWRVGFGVDGIEFRSGWRASRMVPWSDVTGIAFSTGMKQWKISTATHGTIRINELAIGCEPLLRELRRRGHVVPLGSTE